MLILGINWQGRWAQVVTDTGTYNCPIQERDDDFYFKFKNQWHKVGDYVREDMLAEVYKHKQGMEPQRQSISQDEFEMICRKVLSRHSSVIDFWFEGIGTVHIVYPSHSGKSRNGATLYFGELGYITNKGWQYDTGSNEGIIIGEEISKLIQRAMYSYRDTILP